MIKMLNGALAPKSIALKRVELLAQKLETLKAEYQAEEVRRGNDSNYVDYMVHGKEYVTINSELTYLKGLV